LKIYTYILHSRHYGAAMHHWIAQPKITGFDIDI